MKIILAVLLGFAFVLLGRSFCPTCGRAAKFIGEMFIPREDKEIFDVEIQYLNCPHCGPVARVC